MPGIQEKEDTAKGEKYLEDELEISSSAIR